jgi:hypothetical protein
MRDSRLFVGAEADDAATGISGRSRKIVFNEDERLI